MPVDLTVNSTIPMPPSPNTPAERAAAARTVAANAVDAQDCAELLDMLGLDWPSDRQSGSASVAVVLAVCIAGALIFLAAITAGQRGMCALHDNNLRYCPGYSAGEGTDR